MKRVRDVMQATVVAVDAGTPLRDALAVMRRERIRHLPVVEAGAVVGMLSERDLGRVMAADYDTALERPRDRMKMLDPVRAAMQQPVASVEADAPLREAVAVMQRERLGAIVVVDQAGAPSGIVTTIDLLGALADLLAHMERRST